MGRGSRWLAETRARAAGQWEADLSGTQALSVGEAGASVPNALLLGRGLAAWVGVFRWLQGWAGKESAGADDMSLWGAGGAVEKDSFGVPGIKRFLCEG